MAVRLRTGSHCRRVRLSYLAYYPPLSDEQQKLWSQILAPVPFFNLHRPVSDEDFTKYLNEPSSFISSKTMHALVEKAPTHLVVCNLDFLYSPDGLPPVHRGLRELLAQLPRMPSIAFVDQSYRSFLLAPEQASSVPVLVPHPLSYEFASDPPHPLVDFRLTGPRIHVPRPPKPRIYWSSSAYRQATGHPPYAEKERAILSCLARFEPDFEIWIPPCVPSEHAALLSAPKVTPAGLDFQAFQKLIGQASLVVVPYANSGAGARAALMGVPTVCIEHADDELPRELPCPTEFQSLVATDWSRLAEDMGAVVARIEGAKARLEAVMHDHGRLPTIVDVLTSLAPPR